MRVITGFAKKKPLLTLDDKSLRPTISRIKEAMFSIIQLKIENSKVLDLFSGSGQLGIEALSRGAKNCTFVDCSLKAHQIEIQNLKSTNLHQKSKVLLTDGIKFLQNTKKKYDIIFLDPPYKTSLLKEALEIIHLKIETDGIVVCEHMKNLEIKDYFSNISLQKQYNYGRISLTIYKKEN